MSEDYDPEFVGETTDEYSFHPTDANEMDTNQHDDFHNF